MKTLVSHIERGSTFDGPGIRTVVFLKGCPLSCKWCHNPECISFDKQILFYPDKCVYCGACSRGEECYSGARKVCGEEISVDEVVSEIKKDVKFFASGGGATISGGEPLAHRDFTLALIRALKKENINVGVETSLYRFDSEILSLCDVVMADLKIWDGEKHLKYVGIANDGIKANFLKLDSLGVPIIVRTPLIGFVNDDEAEVKAISDFALNLKNAVKYELLPYHPLGISKAQALGEEQEKFEPPSDYRLKLLEKYTFVKKKGANND